jgi:hypothetical protein
VSEIRHRRRRTAERSRGKDIKAPLGCPSSTEDQNALIVGREDTFHLHPQFAACVQEISFENQHDKPAKTSWKLVAPDDIEVKVPLAEVEPGTATMTIKQFAVTKPIDMPLHTYAEEGHLDHFVIHAGDYQGVLKGARLDLVASLDVSTGIAGSR